MDITISFRHIDTDKEIKLYIEEKMAKLQKVILKGLTLKTWQSTLSWMTCVSVLTCVIQFLIMLMSIMSVGNGRSRNQLAQ